MTMWFVPQASAGAEGASKVQALPHSTDLLVAQVIEGGEVSTTVTVWLHVLVLLQASIAAQVRVAEKVFPHSGLVTVFRMTMWFVPQASAGAEGASKVQALPHSTDLLVAQVMDGGVVSTTVTVWLHVLVLLQASIAAHVRVAEKVLPQSGLVTVFNITMRFVPHASGGAEGASKVQALPHSTDLLVA